MQDAGTFLQHDDAAVGEPAVLLGAAFARTPTAPALSLKILQHRLAVQQGDFCDPNGYLTVAHGVARPVTTRPDQDRPRGKWRLVLSSCRTRVIASSLHFRSFTSFVPVMNATQYHAPFLTQNPEGSC